MHRQNSLKFKFIAVMLLVMLMSSIPVVCSVPYIGVSEVYASSYDSWINDTTIYNGSGDDRASHSTEDTGDEDTGDSGGGILEDVWKWITGTKNTVKDSITKFIGWIQFWLAGGAIFTALYQELSFIVLGRVTGLADWNAYQFQLVQGNVYAIIGSTGYTVTRGICLAAMVVYAAWLFFKTSIENTGSTREEVKGRITSFLVAFAALVFFPNILEVMIYLRDTILHAMYMSPWAEAVYNAQRYTDPDNLFNTVGTMVTTIGNGGVRIAVYVIAVQVLVLVFQVYYVSVALSMAILMVIAPIVFVMSITNKELLENWSKQLIGALSVPIVDYILIGMVFMINGNEHPWIQLFAAMSIFPIRDMIRNILGLGTAKNSEMFGVGAMMAAGNLAKLAAMAALTAATAGAGAAVAEADAATEAAMAAANAGEGAGAAIGALEEGTKTAAGDGALNAAGNAADALNRGNISPENAGNNLTPDKTEAKAKATAKAATGKPSQGNGDSLDDKLKKFQNTEDLGENKGISGNKRGDTADDLKSKAGDGINEKGQIKAERGNVLNGNPEAAGNGVIPDEDIADGNKPSVESDGLEVGTDGAMTGEGTEPVEVEVSSDERGDESKVDTEEFSQGNVSDINGTGTGTGSQDTSEEEVIPDDGKAIKATEANDMDSKQTPDDSIGVTGIDSEKRAASSDEDLEGTQTGAMTQPQGESDRERNLIKQDQALQKKNTLAREGAELDKNIQAQEGAIGQHRQALSKLKADRNTLNENIGSMEKRLGALKRDDKNPGASAEAAQIQTQLTQAKSQLESVDSQIAQHDSAIAKASGDLQTMKSARSKINGDMRDLDMQIQAHRDTERGYAQMEATTGRSAMGRTFNSVGELRQAEYAANVQSQFANVTNFEMPQYAGVLSHTKRAELYRQKAARIRDQAAMQIGMTTGMAAIGGASMLFMGPRAMAMGASIGGNLGMSTGQAVNIMGDARHNLTETKKAAKDIKGLTPPPMDMSASSAPAAIPSYSAPVPRGESMFQGNNYIQAEGARQEIMQGAVGEDLDRRLAVATQAARAAYIQQMADSGNAQYQSDVDRWQSQPYNPDDYSYKWNDERVKSVLEYELDKRGLEADNEAQLANIQQEIRIVLQDVERAQERLAGYDGTNGYSSQDVNAAAGGRKRIVDILVDNGMDKDSATDMAAAFVPSFKHGSFTPTTPPANGGNSSGLNQPDMALLNNYLDSSSIDSVDDKLMLSGLVANIQETFADAVKNRVGTEGKITAKVKAEVIDEDMQSHGPIYQQMVGVNGVISGGNAESMSKEFREKIINALKSYRI